MANYCSIAHAKPCVATLDFMSGNESRPSFSSTLFDLEGRASSLIMSLTEDSVSYDDLLEHFKGLRVVQRACACAAILSVERDSVKRMNALNLETCAPLDLKYRVQVLSEVSNIRSFKERMRTRVPLLNDQTLCRTNTTATGITSEFFQATTSGSAKGLPAFRQMFIKMAKIAKGHFDPDERGVIDFSEDLFEKVMSLKIVLTFLRRSVNSVLDAIEENSSVFSEFQISDAAFEFFQQIAKTSYIRPFKLLAETDSSVVSYQGDFVHKEFKLRSYDPSYVEHNFLSLFNHPNIISLVCMTNKAKEREPSFLMKRMNLGTIGSFKELTYPIFLKLLVDYLTGLAEIHQKNLVHKDVKPENLFIEDRGEQEKVGVVGDLGLIGPVGPCVFTGTPFFLAPELFNPEAFQTGATDMWSFGVTILAILFQTQSIVGYYRYAKEFFDEYRKAIIDGTFISKVNARVNELEAINKKRAGELDPEGVIREAAKGLLVIEPTKRRTAEELRDHFAQYLDVD